MAIVKKVRKLGSRPTFGAASRGTSALRPAFVEKVAPCVFGCPNGTDVRGLLTTLALGESRGLSRDQIVEAAFRLLAERNPFPATAGYLCVHHCEDDCHRGGVDEAVAVNEVERAVGEAAIAMRLPLERVLPAGRQRVAVIGAGPAGLSAACQLARLGFAVTVFDRRPRAGGELWTAIDEGRVPREVVEAEIARIEALGVRLECGADAAGEGYDRVIRTKVEGAGDPAAGEGYDRVIRTKVEGTGDPAAGLAAAVHFGRHAAQLVDAELRGVAIHRLSTPPRAPRERIRFDQVRGAADLSALRSRATPASDGGPAKASSEGGPVGGSRVRAAGRTMTMDEAIAEARRCLACGGCLECDNCWKYCPDQAVIKPLERGQPYRFRLEFCQGCSKCAEECPTGYIEMR